MTQKIKVNQKNGQIGLYKNFKVLHLKTYHKKVYRQPTRWEKIFALLNFFLKGTL